MRVFSILLAVSMLATALSGYDFKTNSGKNYQGAGIGKITSAGMELILPSGLEVIPLDDVPKDLVDKLSPKRRKRFFKALEEYRAVPPEERAKEQRKQEARKRMIEEGWKMHRNLQLWLKSFSAAKSPSEDACLFATMSRSFLREFQAAKNDPERADVFAAFLKKVKEAGLTGELKLDIPRPSMPQYSSPRTNYPTKPPRGARSYKVNGRRITR